MLISERNKINVMCVNINFVILLSLLLYFVLFFLIDVFMVCDYLGSSRFLVGANYNLLKL